MSKGPNRKKRDELLELAAAARARGDTEGALGALDAANAIKLEAGRPLGSVRADANWLLENASDMTPLQAARDALLLNEMDKAEEKRVKITKGRTEQLAKRLKKRRTKKLPHIIG